MTSVKNIMPYLSFFAFLIPYSSYLVCVPSFKPINSSSLSRKNYDREKVSFPHPVNDYEVKRRR